VGDEEQVHAYLKTYCEKVAIPTGGIQVIISNSVWTDKNVKEKYIKDCVRDFSAEIRPMGSAEQINKYVEKTTRGMIPKILEQTVCVLVISLYCIAVWYVVTFL